MEEKRLFIALPCASETKDTLMENIAMLEQCGKFRPSRRDNLHLTVVYVGETIREKDVRQALQDIVMHPFVLEFDELVFLKRPEGKLIWQGIKENNHLKELFAQALENLQWRGFTNLNQNFKPHITLGRRYREYEDCDNEILESRLMIPKSVLVDELILYESTQKDTRLHYEALASLKFIEK